MSNVIKFKKAEKPLYPEVVHALTSYLLEEADLPNRASLKDNVVKFQNINSVFRFIQIPRSYWSIFTSSFIIQLVV